MRKKRCTWGTCNSDSRYSSEDYMYGVTFRPFPKPKAHLGKCRGWIMLCNRPHTDLSVDKTGGDQNVWSKSIFTGLLGKIIRQMTLPAAKWRGCCHIPEEMVLW
ncbi:hypothetical protein PoB_003884300 [Plakobranchus ocellatus]|uniref:THAP-type domain-containing protein n=1 Tax=Plakobranchus ocellatus TaxID=259542 RepID=A0AAV4AYE1_9GAST|nr:hypothetical protein PoB_003884300 [Plakobranchus ocellatus]